MKFVLRVMSLPSTEGAARGAVPAKAFKPTRKHNYNSNDIIVEEN